VQEIFGALRSPVLVEIARCAHIDETKGVGKANTHHATLDELAQPHACVVAVAYDIDALILEHDLQLDVGGGARSRRRRRADGRADAPDGGPRGTWAEQRGAWAKPASRRRPVTSQTPESAVS